MSVRRLAQAIEGDGQGGPPVVSRPVATMAVALCALVALLPAIALFRSPTSNAEFADFEVFGTNRLGAATLDLSVEPGDGDPGSDDPGAGGADASAVFSATGLAPGDSVSGQLVLTNTGDVPLRYGLLAVLDGGPLGDALRFEGWTGTGTCAVGQTAPRQFEDLAFGTDPTVVIDVDADPPRILQSGEQVIWCLGAHLPIETGNGAQGLAVELTLLVPVVQAIGEGL